MDIVLEAIGWIGSALVVISLTQARVLRFRWMNLAGSVIATAYNAVIGIWPFFAMNLAIAIINTYWLWRLYREADDPGVYQALPVSPDNLYLRHVLNEHHDDVATWAPAFDLDDAEGRYVLLVVRGDEAVGVVALRDRGDGTGEIELDWVKPRFRDFTPGQFVYRDGGALADAGFTSVDLVPSESTDREYLRKVGFATSGERWVKALTPAS